MDRGHHPEIDARLEALLKDPTAVLTYESVSAGYSRYDFQVRSKDAGDYKKVYVESYTITKEGILRSDSTSKQQKFLCVNGPLAGQKHILTEAAVDGYVPFNRAAFSRGGRNHTVPRVVLVHTSAFEVKP